MLTSSNSVCLFLARNIILFDTHSFFHISGKKWPFRYFLILTVLLFMAENYRTVSFSRGQLTRVNANEDQFVAWKFLDLLRVVLARMVGSGWLHPLLGGLQFWRNFPNKYHTVRSYEKSKVRGMIIIVFSLYVIE